MKSAITHRKVGFSIVAVIIFSFWWVNGGVNKANADEMTLKDWIKTVQKMRVEGKDVEILKSDNMTPEKSPEEFWERFMEEAVKKDFNHRVFIQKVTRGLVVERRYVEDNRRIITYGKQNINQNYHFVNVELRAFERIDFNVEKFCLFPSLMEKLCDETGKCHEPPLLSTHVVYSLESEDILISYDKSRRCIKEIEFTRDYGVKY